MSKVAALIEDVKKTVKRRTMLAEESFIMMELGSVIPFRWFGASAGSTRKRGEEEKMSEHRRLDKFVSRLCSESIHDLSV